MRLADIKDAGGKPVFSDPDDIGQSEYRVLYELCEDICENMEGGSASDAEVLDALCSTMAEVSLWSKVFIKNLTIMKEAHARTGVDEKDAGSAG